LVGDFSGGQSGITSDIDTVSSVRASEYCTTDIGRLKLLAFISDDNYRTTILFGHTRELRLVSGTIKPENKAANDSSLAPLSLSHEVSVAAVTRAIVGEATRMFREQDGTIR
jgi:hypothetical protein